MRVECNSPGDLSQELLMRQRFRAVTPQKSEIPTVFRESWLLLSLVMSLWDACQVPKWLYNKSAAITSHFCWRTSSGPVMTHRVHPCQTKKQILFFFSFPCFKPPTTSLSPAFSNIKFSVKLNNYNCIF